MITSRAPCEKKDVGEWKKDRAGCASDRVNKFTGKKRYEKGSTNVFNSISYAIMWLQLKSSSLL